MWGHDRPITTVVQNCLVQSAGLEMTMWAFFALDNGAMKGRYTRIFA